MMLDKKNKTTIAHATLLRSFLLHHNLLLFRLRVGPVFLLHDPDHLLLGRRLLSSSSVVALIRFHILLLAFDILLLGDPYHLLLHHFAAGGIVLVCGRFLLLYDFHDLLFRRLGLLLDAVIRFRVMPLLDNLLYDLPSPTAFSSEAFRRCTTCNNSRVTFSNLSVTFSNP